MTSEATLTGQSKACALVLYMALELSDTTWKVLFASRAGRRKGQSPTSLPGRWSVPGPHAALKPGGARKELGYAHCVANAH